MKIYSRIVIDIETLETLEVECFEYDGPVAQCGSGGGGTTTSTTTNTPDYEYNARMATISEKQQAMADEYFKFWETDYKPLEAEQIASNRELIPGMTELQKGKTEADIRNLPAAEELQKRQLGLGIAEATGKSTIAPEYYKQALLGVNSDKRVSEARADVAHNFAQSDDILRRDAGRYGINVGSESFLSTMSAMGIDRAKAMAGATTAARTGAETESFARLDTAMTKPVGIGA